MDHNKHFKRKGERMNLHRFLKWSLVLLVVLLMGALIEPVAQAFMLNVVDQNNNPINTTFRWLLEEDNTNQPVPGLAVADSIGVDIHKSHAPVIAKGQSRSADAFVDVPADKRYMVSVLSDSGYAMGGASVAIGQNSVTVYVNPLPIPTAQISVLVFKDHNSINNAFDNPAEPGLADFTITISDAGGQVMQDVFGNPLGTTYAVDEMGNPVVDIMGTGEIKSDANGEALIKYLPPGKYGVLAVPPIGQNWIQTATLKAPLP